MKYLSLLFFFVFSVAWAAGDFSDAQVGAAIETQAVYSGKVRPISIASKKKLSAFYGVEPDFPTFAGKFRYEVEVSVEGREYWLPLSGNLLLKMRAELQAGQKFDAGLRFLGKSGNSEVLLLENFSGGSRNP